jgi:hypothetical protein
MYSGKLLTMGRGTARNIYFLDKNKLGKISASVGFIKNKNINYSPHKINCCEHPAVSDLQAANLQIFSLLRNHYTKELTGQAMYA